MTLRRSATLASAEELRWAPVAATVLCHFSQNANKFIHARPREARFNSCQREGSTEQPCAIDYGYSYTEATWENPPRVEAEAIFAGALDKVEYVGRRQSVSRGKFAGHAMDYPRDFVITEGREHGEPTRAYPERVTIPRLGRMGSNRKVSVLPREADRVVSPADLQQACVGGDRRQPPDEWQGKIGLAESLFGRDTHEI